VETLRQDLRYALRTLGRNRVFTFIAVLTLALGIGANTAIFSVVHGVVLRPLGFHEPERLVQLFGGSTVRGTFSGPNFDDVRAEASSFEMLTAFYRRARTLTGAGDPERVPVAGVTEGFFALLGRPPVLGREFTAEEMQPGRHRVAVLAHGFWQERFGGDVGVLGEAVLLDGEPYEVVGVAPPGFAYPDGRALWVPLERDDMYAERGAVWLDVVGRLRPGAALAAAEAELDGITARLAAAYPDVNANLQLLARPLHDVAVGDVRRPLLILLAAVAFVLLIACANVANLLLARSATRAGELGLRVALGAGRARLVRQFLTESLVLALAGGAAGLLLAALGTRLLVALGPAWLPRLDQVGVDGTVAAFTLGVSLLAGVLFGLAPALQVARADLRALLAEHGRGLGGRGRGRSGLVVAQTALAVVLLVGAGLMLRSFARLVQVDAGFRAEQALAFPLALPEASYPGDPETRAFFAGFLERLEALPGVERAAAVLVGPMSGGAITISFGVAGREPLPPGQIQTLHVRSATPDYFGTAGIPVLRGRGLAATDDAGAPPVAVLNAAAVRTFFPDEDPLGRRIEMGWTRDEGSVSGEVVGVVGDVRHFGLASDPVPEIYFPHAQLPLRGMTVVLRATGDPLALVPAVRAQLAAMDPALAPGAFATLEQTVRGSAAQPRFYLLLLGLFATVAVVLATIGIYGVTSFVVARRTREIGIRMALGADAAAVLRQVVGGSLALATAGIAAGLAGAAVVTRLLEGLLYGVGATDPWTYAAVALIFTAVAALAALVPARRAARVDPTTALRAE
jgi:putative ABC transport system permease protein